jgi:hypothetical protein
MLRTASSFPIRAFDAGLRPRPFPDETASLLPGLLAATRTGLTPASDDELTNTINRYVTANLLFYWADEKGSVINALEYLGLAQVDDLWVVDPVDQGVLLGNRQR